MRHLLVSFRLKFAGLLCQYGWALTHLQENILTSYIRMQTWSCFYGMTDNLKLYRTAPDISIFNLLTRVQIIFAAAYYRWKPVTKAGRFAIPNPFLCFLVCWFCYPYQFDPISCLFPDNSCCTATVQDQVSETHLRRKLIFFFFPPNEICYQHNFDTQIHIFMPNWGTDTRF